MTYMSESTSTTVPIESTVEYAEESTELTLAEDGSAHLPGVVNVQGLGKIIAASGLFKDARQAAKATVKVLAGQELGFGPIFSMSNIYVIEGKISIGATMIAAKIRGSGMYDYKFLEHSVSECKIAIINCATEEIVGEAAFDSSDAKRANLLNKSNWKKYPQDMYFARAIGRAARWHLPHLFGGAIYTPEELGAMIADDGTVVIEGEAKDITEKATPALNLKGSAAVIDEPTLSRGEGQESPNPSAQATGLQAEGMSVEQIADAMKAPKFLVRSWLGIPA